VGQTPDKRARSRTQAAPLAWGVNFRNSGLNWCAGPGPTLLCFGRMRSCPNCGTLNTGGGAQCVACSRALPSSPIGALGGAPPKPSGATSTLSGTAKPAVATMAAGGPQTSTRSTTRTLLGITALVPAASASPELKSDPVPPTTPRRELDSNPTPTSGPPAQARSAQASPSARSAGDSLAPSLRSQRSRRDGKLVLALAGCLLFLLAAFAWGWHPSPPLRAEVVESGATTQLRVWCENCADGTLLRHGEQAAQFANQVADVNLQDNLKVGDNSVLVNLDRPGFGRDEDVTLQIPVRFQLEADFSHLSDGRLGATIHAGPNAAASADSVAVPLTSGVGTAAFDFTAQATGPSTEVTWATHSFEFSVHALGVTESRSFTVRAPVVPLTVETPNSFTVVDTAQFMLAGQSAKGASVSVAGAPIAVDAQGRFAQLMSIDAEGETQFHVRAELKGSAPREVQLKVRRVLDKRRAAREFNARALRKYSEIRPRLELKDKPDIALHGIVRETRTGGYSAAALLEIAAGCDSAPCFIKVIHSLKSPLTSGHYVSVFGRATGLVAAPIGSTPIPEVEAYFLLP
jgi:hypothetical protein